MTELESFTASLKDLGLTKEQRIERIKEWKISNKPLDVKEEKPIDLKVETEISEEINKDIDPVKPAKTNVSTSADPTVETEKDTGSSSEVALSGLPIDPIPPEPIFPFANEDAAPFEFNQTYTAPPGETFDYGDGAYKYTVDPISLQPIFYAKALGSDEWVDTTGDGLATMLVASRLGFIDDFNIDDYIQAEEEVQKQEPKSELDQLEDGFVTEDGDNVGDLDEVVVYAFKKEETALEKKIRLQYEEYQEASDVTLKEYLAIQNEVGLINLDTQVAETVKAIPNSNLSGMDLKMAYRSEGTTENVTTTTIPYEEERNIAISFLQSQKEETSNEEPITEAEIRGVTKLQIARDKYTALKDQKNRDYLSDISDEERKQNHDYALGIESTFDPEIESIKLVEEFESLKNSDIVKTVNLMSVELQRVYEQISTLGAEIKEKQKIGINSLDDQNTYNALAASFNKRSNVLSAERKTIQQQFDLINYDYAEFIATNEVKDTAEENLDYLKRSYSLSEKYFGRPSMTGISFGGGGLAPVTFPNAVGFFTDSELGMGLLNTTMSWVQIILQSASSVDDKTIANAGILAPGLFMSKILAQALGDDFLEAQAGFKDLIELRKDRFVKDVDFGKGPNGSFYSFPNFLYFLSQTAIEQLPFFATVAIPYAGLYLAALSAGGDYYVDEFNRAKAKGVEFDREKTLAKAFGFALVEGLGSALPMKMQFKYIQNLKLDKQTLESGVGAFFRDVRKAAPDFLKLTAADVGGEVLITQLWQNVISGRPMYEGFGEAGFTSLIFSTSFTGVPIIAGASMRALSDPTTNAEFDQNVRDIAEYQEIIAKNEGGPDLDINTKIYYKGLIDDKLKRNDAILKERSELIDLNLDATGWKLYVNSINRLTYLKEQAISLRAEAKKPGITIDVSKQIAALELEFSITKSNLDAYLVAFTKKFGLLSVSVQNDLKDRAKAKLKSKGNNSPSDAQLLNIAEQLYTEDTIRGNAENDFAMISLLRGKGIDVNYSILDTNADALAAFTDMVNARIADPNIQFRGSKIDPISKKEAGLKAIEDFKAGLKDGTVNGINFISINVKTGQPVYDSVVTIENAILNNNGSVGLHEITGHVIFTEALGTNPEAFKSLAGTILTYLAEFDYDAYVRIARKTEGQGFDEVLTVFLEELDRINFEKGKEQGFWSTLGIGFNKATSEAVGKDFDYDFKGAKGVVELLRQVAEGYKNQTLTEQSITDIINSDVWQGDIDGQLEDGSVGLDEVVITAKKSESISPEGAKFLSEWRKGLFTNEDLVLTIRQGTEKDKYPAAEAFVEANFGVIKPILGYERRGKKGIDENDVKKAIIEIILGGEGAKWTGKTTPLFEEGEGYNPDFAVTTYIRRLGDRKDIIYERAKELGDVVFNTNELNDSSAGTVEMADPVNVEASEQVTIDPFKVTKLANANPIIDFVKEQIESGKIDLDNMTLKDLKPFSEIAAQQLAVQLGIPVARILKPNDNLRKGEVTPVQMWIKSNGPTLLALLKQVKGNASLQTVQTKNGKTKKIGGEGRRIGQTLLDAFFIKGPKINNNIQYKLDPSKLNLTYFYSVFGLDSKGNIKNARGTSANASKAILELIARLQTLKAIELAIDAKVQEGSTTESEGAKQKAQVKRSEGIKVERDFKKGVFVVPLPDLTTIVTQRVNSKGETVKARKVDLTTPAGIKIINDLEGFFKLHPKQAYLFRSGMTGGFGFTFTDTPTFDKIFPGLETTGDLTRQKYTVIGGYQNGKAITKLVEDPDLIKKKQDLLKDLFLNIQSYIKKNPDSASTFSLWQMESSKDQNHPIRFLAPTVFYAIDPFTKRIKLDVKVTEEHMMPNVQAGKSLLDAAIKGQVESEFDNIISKSYGQGGLRYLNDLALEQFGLLDRLPKSYYDLVVPLLEAGKLDFLPAGMASWIRYSENNVANPFEYNLIKPNITIGEFFVGKLTGLDGLKGADFQVGIDMAGMKANGLITRVLTGDMTVQAAKAEFKVYQRLLKDKVASFNSNNVNFGSKTKLSQSISGQIEILNNYDTALEMSRRINPPVMGISVLDFDDTVGITSSKIGVTMPDGTFKKIDATEFALEHTNLEDIGATFDFSEFNKVIGGKRGPLFGKLKRAVEKYGNKNVFILTARPAGAAPAIYAWLKSEGVTLIEGNIVGLANGAPQAKANWIVGKAAEGYNDFYFADDAIKNAQAVKAVLDVLDIKSEVQIAKQSKSIVFTSIINDIIEQKTGIEAYKQYSAAKAQTIGASKGKYNFYIPPSAEDFTGLLYKLLGKGAVGDAQMAFFKDNLLDPYNRAEIEIGKAKVSAGADFKALKAKFPKLPKSFKEQTGIGKFNYEHAIRVYLWDSQGMTVPGLSKKDQKQLVDFIKADPDLKVFSDELITIQKGKPYPKPGKSWVAGTITTDVISGINKVNRAQYLQEWQQNIDIIFAPAVLNKLEAAFGPAYVKALKNSIQAQKIGSNRTSAADSITTRWYDWINNSVGVVMFLNTRSALMQMISNVNFINWSDNNPLKAAQAFANQPQYWKDVMFLLNSPYLVERRDGLKINISESEIADLAATDGNKAKDFVALALNKGFVFTRYADSFAIATGGATYYRNRLKALLATGMDPKLAERKAYEDFYAISETAQQSSNPAKISDQQRSAAGRLILSFGNTQMQYARIQKRAIEDLIARRGNDRENISKLVYYSTVQNLMFNALTQGMQFLLFDDDEDPEASQASKDQRISRTLNGMFDSQVRGLGIQGALAVTLKNTLMTIAEENDKKSPDYAEAIDDLFSISPPLQAKLRKLKSSANTFSWNKQEMEDQGFHANNPAYLATAQTISALTNIPVDEAVLKINALRTIFSNSSENWQKVAVALGWSTWDVGLPYYGVDDKVVQTPEMKVRAEIDDMKDQTTTKEQTIMLLDLGLTKKQIKTLRIEENRVKKIIELQNKKKQDE